MKILLINDYASASGGAELFVLGLRDRLREIGHDACIFSTCAGAQGSTIRSDYQCFGTLSRFRPLLQWINPWAFVSLRRVLKEFQPDVVQVTIFLTQLSPLILPLLKKFPAIHYAVWHRSICLTGTKLLPDRSQCAVRVGSPCLRHRCVPLWDWLPLMLQMKLLRRWYGVFDLVAATSKDLAKSLAANGINVAEVVWSGVPQERCPASPVKEIPVIAFAGRLVREKGADVLLQAFALVLQEVPAARLLIAGDGPERAQLESFVKAAKLTNHVQFLGHVSRNELDHLFSQAWVQVVPSLAREGFGMVAAEAMLRGTAVIASNIGGLIEFVAPAGGVLVPPGRVSDLSEAITSLLQDFKTVQTMGIRARQFALKNLTEQATADKLLQLYRRVTLTAKEGCSV